MSASENILTNIDNVAYTTFFDAEKVVKTFTGSFKYTTSTTTISYTLAGFANNQQAYRIVHGFTRPVFVELQWSLDNVNWSVGGASAYNSNDFAIGFSDSTYIYILMPYFTGSAGDNVYYKVVCSWITDYDDTNPDVPPFAEIPDSYTQVFSSRSLFPPVVQQGTISLSTTSGAYTDVTGKITHNLGYAPNYKAFVESFSGQVWPLNFGGSGNPYNVDDNQVEAQVFTSTTDMTVDMYTKSANGTRKVWYLLYGQNTDVLNGSYGYGQAHV